MQKSKQNINGIEVLTHTWETDSPIGKVIIIHGYGEHAARYGETAGRLNRAGYSVYSYDRRGEGASEGKRASIKRFDTQVEDFVLFKDRIDTESLPTYLMGHSLGGLIAVKYLIDYQPDDIRGVILSSPLLKPDDDMAPILQKIAPIVASLLPWMPSVKLDVNLISRDANEVKKYIDDPLIYHGATNAKTGYEFLKAMSYVQSNFSKFEYPFLVMHGSEDKITDPKGSQMLYDGSSSKDKTIKIFEGLYHETMREPEKEMFFESVTSWLKTRKENKS